MEPGVQGSLTVSGVQCMAFRIHDLTWVVGMVLGLGPGCGVQLLVLGLLLGPGSVPPQACVLS